MTVNKEKTAGLIKSHRIAKGYTQSELAERAKVSLRSIQRIESGAVTPRLYTLKILAEQLGFEVEKEAKAAENYTPSVKNTNSKRTILTIGVGITLTLFSVAFISQSSKFPETNFENFTFWGIIATCYTLFLLKLWK
jgi:transcriptional regulator with XRE-family HTH domain